MTIHDFLVLFTCFYVYAFLGWGVEIAYHAITTGHLVNRGMLAGPVCPIYGAGMVLIVVALYSLNLFATFLGVILICTLLELLVGLVLKAIFHAQWWDYSGERFNIAGLICPKFSLYWGIAGLFAVRVIDPIVRNLLSILPSWLLLLICIISGIILLTDLVITAAGIFSMERKNAQLEELQSEMRNASDVIGQNITDWTLAAESKVKPHAALLQQDWEIATDDFKKDLYLGKTRWDAFLDEIDKRIDAYEQRRDESIAQVEATADRLEENALNRLKQLETRYKRLVAKSSRTERRLSKAFPTMSWNKHKKK